MYININIFDVILAIFFSTCLVVSHINFLRLGGCGHSPIERQMTIYAWRDNLIMAFVNLIVYIVLKGSFVVFLVCLPIGLIFAYAFESVTYGFEYMKEITLSNIFGIVNIATIIGILLYHFL